MYKDICNNQLQPGDFITYAAMRCDSPALRMGRIVELTQSKPSSYIKPVPKIKVLAVEITCNGPQQLSKLVTLEHFDRICKVAKDSLSPQILRLLEAL